ncbi:phosphoglycerate mutase-like protein [Hortaea werneckii]|nr:phosphoglycerate mutase-like protein [Hortaea werneckii]
MHHSPDCSFEHGGRTNGIEHPAKQDEEKHGCLPTKLRPVPESSSGAAVSTWLNQRLLFAGQVILFTIIVVQAVMLYRSLALASACGIVDAGALRRQTASGASSSSDIPQYYQTSPELFPGPTPTGEPAFLAQTNPAPFPSTTYIPPSPLETQVPIQGNKDDGNIFHMMGQLSHYFPNPDGFGVDEYPLPENATIKQLNMLSRHGARYPTTGSGAPMLAEKITNYTTGVLGDVEFTGPLSFLNKWQYQLGAEILVPVGKQELFDSGTLHQYMYGHLYPNNGSKIIARSTTQDRMTKTAEYFLAGFFGLDWPSNATLVLAIEGSDSTWNNSLAGYDNCPNSNKPVSAGGNNATIEWYSIYLADATERLRPHAPGFNWTVTDTYNAQSMCAYETVALGYSAFCDLFTFEEWQGYEYSVDLYFAGGYGFQSPTGRAVGIGYVQEILARLQHHVIDHPVAQINLTLDNNTATFPLDQTLNFDFSHDTNIMAILSIRALPPCRSHPHPPSQPHSLTYGTLRRAPRHGNPLHSLPARRMPVRRSQVPRRSADDVHPLPPQPAHPPARPEFPGVWGPRRWVV